jgi:hypothetical protein
MRNLFCSWRRAAAQAAPSLLIFATALLVHKPHATCVYGFLLPLFKGFPIPHNPEANIVVIHVDPAGHVMMRPPAEDQLEVVAVTAVI